MKHYLLGCFCLLLTTLAQAQTGPAFPADTTQRSEFFYSHNRQDEFTIN